mgnify:CR=1 FL=1
MHLCQRGGLQLGEQRQHVVVPTERRFGDSEPAEVIGHVPGVLRDSGHAEQVQVLRVLDHRHDQALAVVERDGDSQVDPGARYHLVAPDLGVHERVVLQRFDGRLGDEVTVNRYMRYDDRIELLPENEAFKPIIVTQDSGEFAIEGLAVGLMRVGI